MMEYFCNVKSPSNYLKTIPLSSYKKIEKILAKKFLSVLYLQELKIRIVQNKGGGGCKIVGFDFGTYLLCWLM